MVRTRLKTKGIENFKPLKAFVWALLCIVCIAKANGEAPKQVPSKQTKQGSQAPNGSTGERNEREEEGSSQDPEGLRLPEVDYSLSPRTGLDINLEEDTFTIHVGGRLYLDAVQYFEDKNDLGDTPIALRTVQLNVLGNFLSNWRYKLSWSGFTKGGSGDGGGVALGDAFVDYIGFSSTTGQTADQPAAGTSARVGTTKILGMEGLPPGSRCTDVDDDTGKCEETIDPSTKTVYEKERGAWKIDQDDTLKAQGRTDVPGRE